MKEFWEERKKDLKQINARRARELAVKHFRSQCPVGRMAARLGLALALRDCIKTGAGII
jgi:hypothetical protein